MMDISNGTFTAVALGGALVSQVIAVHFKVKRDQFNNLKLMFVFVGGMGTAGIASDYAQSRRVSVPTAPTPAFNCPRDYTPPPVPSTLPGRVIPAVYTQCLSEKPTPGLL
jgi:hypothetical protein